MDLPFFSSANLEAFFQHRYWHPSTDKASFTKNLLFRAGETSALSLLCVPSPSSLREKTFFALLLLSPIEKGKETEEARAKKPSVPFALSPAEARESPNFPT